MTIIVIGFTVGVWFTLILTLLADTDWGGHTTEGMTLTVFMAILIGIATIFTVGYGVFSVLTTLGILA